MSLPPSISRCICLSTLDVCAVCLQPNATKVCGNCGCNVYCSKQCQKLDWKTGGHNQQGGGGGQSHKDMCPLLEVHANVSVWFRDVKSTIKKAQKHELLSIAPDGVPDDKKKKSSRAKTSSSTTSSSAAATTIVSEEVDLMFQKAIDLGVGKKGIVQARDRSMMMVAEDLKPSDGTAKATTARKPDSMLDHLPDGPYNPNKSKKLLVKAAKCGHVAAMYQLATYYWHFEQFKNEKEGYKWCRKAAFLGHAEAQQTMGGQYWL